MEFAILESTALTEFTNTIPNLSEWLFHPQLQGAWFYSDALKHVGGDGLLEDMIQLGYTAATTGKQIFHIDYVGDHYYLLGFSENSLLTTLRTIAKEKE